VTDLTPISALGAAAALERKIGPLLFIENSELALVSLALRRRTARPTPMGLALPEPGRWAAGQGVAVFWAGRDQWMIEAEGRATEDFAPKVAAEAPGCSVTEQTDGWTAFEIISDRGEAPIRAFLEKLANLDVDAFGPGSATRTGVHHMSVFLIRRAEDRLGVIGMRSLAGDLWHALEEAAQRQEGDKT
jgi:heterotetrameric sarcosine oxidase gamma subunit